MWFMQSSSSRVKWASLASLCIQACEWWRCWQLRGRRPREAKVPSSSGEHKVKTGEAGEWLPARVSWRMRFERGVLPQLPPMEGTKSYPTSIVPAPFAALSSPHSPQLCHEPRLQYVPVCLPAENVPVPNRRGGLCQFNGMCCTPQKKKITRTCSELTSQPHSLSFPLYMLDRAAGFYGWSVLWQCERHRKERPCFLWCPCCCGPEQIRTHTDGCTHSHEQTNHNTDPCACLC